MLAALGVADSAVSQRILNEIAGTEMRIVVGRDLGARLLTQLVARGEVGDAMQV